MTVSSWTIARWIDMCDGDPPPSQIEVSVALIQRPLSNTAEPSGRQAAARIDRSTESVDVSSKEGEFPERVWKRTIRWISEELFCSSIISVIGCRHQGLVVVVQEPNGFLAVSEY